MLSVPDSGFCWHDGRLHRKLGELSKLLETTWLGILVGWAQEIERMASQCGGSYDEVNAFIKEVSFLPSHVFPGRIGGHCVMPNIAILRAKFPSRMLGAIVESNMQKEKELQVAQSKQYDSREIPTRSRNAGELADCADLPQPRRLQRPGTVTLANTKQSTGQPGRGQTGPRKWYATDRHR